MHDPLLGPILFVVGLIVLDLLALRFGADSRIKGDGRGDWVARPRGAIISDHPASAPLPSRTRNSGSDGTTASARVVALPSRPPASAAAH